MFKKVKNKKGFTLIELIVVIAILAVLAAIIIPTVASSLDRANNARDLANARSTYAAVVLEVLTATTYADTTTGSETAPGGTCTFSVTNRVVAPFTCTLNGNTFSLNTTTGAIE